MARVAADRPVLACFVVVFFVADFLVTARCVDEDLVVVVERVEVERVVADRERVEPDRFDRDSVARPRVEPDGA